MDDTQYRMYGYHAVNYEPSEWLVKKKQNICEFKSIIHKFFLAEHKTIW